MKRSEVKAWIGRMSGAAITSMKPERLTELDLLADALDECGCTDPKARTREIERFLSSDIGLSQYIDLHVTEPMGSA